MLMNKLKISTRLIISSLAFFLPVLVTLIFIVSSYNATIRFAEKEVHGDAYLRPLSALLEGVAAYGRTVEGPVGAGERRKIGDAIEASFTKLLAVDGKYGKELLFTADDLAQRGRSDAKADTMATFWKEQLKRSEGASSDSIFEFIAAIRAAITQAGDASNLILDPDLDSYYMMDITLLALPQTQERLIRIHDFINRAYAQARRVTGEDGTVRIELIPEDRNELLSHLAMLSEADYARVLSSAHTSLNEDKNFYELSPSLQSVIPPLLTDYEQANGAFIELLGRLAKEGESDISKTALLEAEKQALDSSFRLWDAGVDELDILIEKRIGWYENRRLLALALTVIALILASAIVFLISQSIRASISQMKRGFSVIEEKDLTKSIEVGSKDELGELMTAFNHFLVEIRETIDSFKNGATLVSDSVFDLSSAAKETSTTANQQSASVSEIVSTMEGNANLSEQIAIKTEEVARLSIQTQEMSERGARLRKDNERMMGEIREQNNKIITDIKQLAEMIGRINEVVGIIDGIADQTKLIAFNASLEASSAGEAGARFSVVASEIRRFADNVVNSTREITGKIQEVRAASESLIKEAGLGSDKIDAGYTTMAEQETVFKDIVDNSQNVATKSQQISNLTKQQELASGQIFTTLKEISLGIRNFVTTTATTSKIAEDLSGMSSRLKTTVESFKTSEGEN